MNFKQTHIFPSTAPLREPTRSWANKLLRVLDVIFQDVAKISFNQSQSVAVADTGTANTEFKISHNMGRTPTGFILVKSDKATNVYDSGGTAWSSTAIYLKADAANAAITVVVF